MKDKFNYQEALNKNYNEYMSDTDIFYSIESLYRKKSELEEKIEFEKQSNNIAYISLFISIGLLAINLIKDNDVILSRILSFFVFFTSCFCLFYSIRTKNKIRELITQRDAIEALIRYKQTEDKKVG